MKAGMDELDGSMASTAERMTREPAALAPYRAMADALDSLHVGLCLFDAEDRTLLWNQAFLRLFPEHDGKVFSGEPYAENLRRFYATRLPQEELGGMERCVAEGIARHRTQTQPYIFEHRGQWVRVVAQPVPGGRRLRIWTPIAPPGASGLATGAAGGDVPLHELMPFAVEDGDGIAVLDPGSRIASANERFARFFGLPRAGSAIGRTLAEVYAACWRAAPCPEAMAETWLQTLAEGERFTGAPFELPLPGGRWVRVLQQRMNDNRVVGTFADISAMKALQRELDAAREAAEQASRAKDGFLATVSHELRTPMNGILGMLDLLDDGRLSEDQAERLGLARQSAEALLGLVDDILAFSRLEAGHLALEASPTGPAQMLDAVTRLMHPRAKEKGLELTWSVGADVPDLVLCDAARLRQVLLNLVANAVKFTEAGRVAVSVRHGGTDRADGRLALEFEVEDTGIGVAAAAQADIFQPFVQADSGIARRFGGTGLGLAICRRLVEAMGGAISVSSVEGQGSRFHFTIAVEEVARGDAPRPVRGTALPSLGPMRVLVVDDHPVNREVARLLLKRLGVAAVSVATAEEALAACAASPFDVILMDLEMPETDGIAAAQAIRASGLPGATAAILAVTAHAGEAHRARCHEAGMAGYLAKPVRVEQLADAIVAATRSLPPLEASAVTLAGAADGLIDEDRVLPLVHSIPPEAWDEILTSFEVTARSSLAEIQAARHGAEHRRAAHSLKGMAWNLGARRLGDAAAAVEGVSAEELGPRLPELAQAVEASIQALRRIRA
jgi:signal transduction histidine kinase/AmiR/NasT family two-component response regulator/HPt (histidine-containing phosphotransfer) domain-containing protein